MKLGFAKIRKTEQILVIRRKRVTRTWCGECQSEADFIPMEEINRLADAGIIPAPFVARGLGLHPGKSPDGSTVFCANSLVKKV